MLCAACCCVENVRSKGVLDRNWIPGLCRGCVVTAAVCYNDGNIGWRASGVQPSHQGSSENLSAECGEKFAGSKHGLGLGAERGGFDGASEEAAAALGALPGALFDAAPAAGPAGAHPHAAGSVA